jgi:hypothetical protein
MGVTAAIGVVGTIGGAAIASDASRKAAHTQADSQAQALDVQKQMFDKQIALEQPFVDAGVKALPQLEAGVAPGGQFNKPYTLADFTAGPQKGLFDFAKGEATEAIGNQLSKMGLGTSTNAIGDVGKLATNLSTKYFDTGFTENLNQNQFTLDSLSRLLGIGTNAVAATNANLGANATAGATAATNIGNAQAGGIVGQGNAVGGAVGSLGQDAATAYLLKNYFTGKGTTGMSPQTIAANAAPGMSPEAAAAYDTGVGTAAPMTLATSFS